VQQCPYNHLLGPNPIWQPFASTGAFITLVNSGLTGVFAALVAVALDAPGPLVGAVAAACGLAFLGGSVTLAVRQAQRLTRGYASTFWSRRGEWCNSARWLNC
jgi:hypothetical protein